MTTSTKPTKTPTKPSTVRKTEQVTVLSIRQPYVELILRGEKWIENRSWQTPYRGRLYIHASGTNAQINRAECRKFGIDPVSLRTGAILGYVDLVDIVKSEWMDDVTETREDQRFAALNSGRKCYKPLPPFVPQCSPEQFQLAESVWDRLAAQTAENDALENPHWAMQPFTWILENPVRLAADRVKVCGGKLNLWKAEI